MMPPRAFGRYEVLARLATGGAANIFMAREPVETGHRIVCVKTLLPERAKDAEFVAMFLDEARLAARLDHPNCVDIHVLGRERNVYYIAMEYIFGETLWNLLATVADVRTPLPQSAVASILASASAGLHHAHELRDPNGRPYNLVHRDVSPQNIMVTFEGQTKVLDFGVAKAETGRAATQTGIVKGKFSYMSPEQITGGSVDRRSDIFSLGIVMFECLASRRLYRADTPEDIASLMLDRRPPRLREIVSDIHPTLDKICSKALSRHPSARYETAAHMEEALLDHLADVGYDTSNTPVRRLITERFAPAIDRRRSLFDGVRAGRYDEPELIAALGARPVFEVDLFPSIEAPTDGRMVPPSKLPFTPESVDELPTGMDLKERSASKGREAGWRVQLDPASGPVEVIGVPIVPEMTGKAEESEAETRFENDGTFVEPPEEGGDGPTHDVEPSADGYDDANDTLHGAEDPAEATSVGSEDATRPVRQWRAEDGATLDDAEGNTDPRAPLVKPIHDPDDEVRDSGTPKPRLSSERGEILRFKVGSMPAGGRAGSEDDATDAPPPMPPANVRISQDAPTTPLNLAVTDRQDSKPAWSQPAPRRGPRTYTLGVVVTAFACGLGLGLLVGLLARLY